MVYVIAIYYSYILYALFVLSYIFFEGTYTINIMVYQYGNHSVPCYISDFLIFSFAPCVLVFLPPHGECFFTVSVLLMKLNLSLVLIPAPHSYLLSSHSSRPLWSQSFHI